MITIGLLIDWLDNDYASSLTFAFHDEICSRKMRFLCFVGHGVAHSGDTPDGSSIAYRLATARCLDGVVIVSLGAGASREDYAARVERLRPLPMCSLVSAIPGVPQIAVDDAAGVRDAVQHLIDVHGRRRIAFIRGPLGVPDADERHRGYVQAHESRNLQLDGSLVVTGDFSAESGRAAARSLLERGTRFDALVAANDGMAAAAMDVLREQGLSIPGDVAVCGFDDVEESRFASPPISSVRQPWRARARLAIDSILAQRAGRAGVSQRVGAEFVPRGSCGCGVQFDVTSASEPLTLALRVANWDWRKSTATSLSKDLGLRGIHLGEEPARALVECYWQEVQGQRDGGFLLLLEQELSERLAERSSLSAWQYSLARLRAHVLDRLQGRADARAKAEALTHAALERVSYAMERQQALRRLEFERQGRLLALAGQAMRTAFNAQGISHSLRQQLPELGIPRFYVSEYRPAPAGDELPPSARLVITHDAAASREGAEPAEFDTDLLVPNGAWPEEPVGFVIEALHFQDERLGFALFQVGPRQGSIYMALREQLSAALKGTALVAQVVERARQREQAERARMEEELRIARRIQVSILPTAWRIEGLEVAAALLPGQLPGADYFDVRPDADGAWLVVGSARGGGLRAGLITPMLQSIVASLCQGPSKLGPFDLLRLSMHVLRENLEVRMQERKYVNLLVARYSTGGLLEFAADYEGVTLCPWHGSPFRPQLTILGASPEGEPLLGGEFQLSPHDLLMLYTQGLTRSSDFEDVPIGDERIARELEQNRASPVEKIRDDMLSTVQRWSGKRADLSVIVGRRLGAS